MDIRHALNNAKRKISDLLGTTRHRHVGSEIEVKHGHPVVIRSRYEVDAEPHEVLGLFQAVQAYGRVMLDDEGDVDAVEFSFRL